MSTERVKRIPSLSLLVAFILFIHVILLAYGAVIHSPAADAPAHLDAGLDMVRRGNFSKNLGNPPLANLVAALPVVMVDPDFELQLTESRALPSTHSADVCRMFTLARFACIPFSVIGAYCCYRWSLELHGVAGGLLSLCLWCFFPNILGHAQLISADVASAAMSVLAGYTLWRWWRTPDWANAALAGTALGLALLAKMVCVILVVLLPAMWLAIRATGWHSPRRAAFSREVGHMAMLLAIAVIVLNWGYGFERTMRPLNEYPRLMSLVNVDQLPKALHVVPVPLPQNYLRGLSDVRNVVQNSHRSYVAGEWRDRGVWHYYLYGLAIKSPLGAIGLVLIATVSSLMCRAANDKAELLFVLIPAASFLVFVSYSCSAISHHFRYLMPVLPFCFVFAGKGLCSGFGLRVRRVAVLTCGVAAISASLWTYPHSVSFFNALAGGPVGGRDHMVDSNLDWGQDLLFLKRWVDHNPQARPLNLAYCGRIDPESVGIEYSLPDRAKHGRPPEGWYAISVNFIMGLEFVAPNGQGWVTPVKREDYTYFQQLTPVARAGYSIDIYHVEGQEKSAEDQAVEDASRSENRP